MFISQLGGTNLSSFGAENICQPDRGTAISPSQATLENLSDICHPCRSMTEILGRITPNAHPVHGNKMGGAAVEHFETQTDSRVRNLGMALAIFR